VEEAYYDSPGKSFTFRLPMYNVRLGVFTQRMLDDAVEAGVEFLDETRCLGALIENEKVVGVKILRDKSEGEIRASLTVDVSGVEAVVRRSLPPDMGIERETAPHDMILVYSEDREVGMEHWQVPFVYHARFQGWSGPRRPGVIGIGLGRFVSTGEDPRKIHPEFARHALPVPGKTIYKTYQKVSVGKPVHKLVANGVMILGDCARQGKPLNGEGLSVMLYAAEMAAKTAVEAWKRRDFSERGLWRYSMEWHREFGARFSSFHRLRYEVLDMSKDDQNFLLGLGLYGPREMSSIMLEGKIAITPATILNVGKLIRKGISRPWVLKRLAQASIAGARLKRLYQNYPANPAELSGWIKKVEELYRVGI
jgi:flavin-dependent dehydrogenase